MSSSENRKNQFSILRVVMLLGAVLAVFWGFLFLGGDYSRGRTPQVARIKSDQRSLATAIETYFVDNATYPAMTMDPAETLDGPFYPAPAPKAVGRTLRARHVTQLTTLTTPVSYITSNFPDPFADTKGAGFRYYSDGRGWVIGSYGPDLDEKSGGQLLWDRGSVEVPPYTDADKKVPRRAAGDEGIERAYNSEFAQPSIYMLVGRGPNGAFTYDPTNGPYSAGDVYRVKQ